MPLILGTNSIKDTGYDVANSLRFDSGSSDHLNRSTSSGDRLKWTWSAWLKKTKNGSDEDLFSGYDNSSNFTRIQIGDTGRFNYINKTSGSQNAKIETNRVFRDNSAWYHFVIVWDTGNATAGNRMRIYVNGVEETSFQSDTQPSQDQVSHVNQDSKTNYVGTFDGSGTFFNGYMAEVVLVDGTQLDETSFGEFDSDSPTIWKPIDVSGLTFGTNGFYLDFENSSSLGADVSGNGNNFTVNNLTSIDQSTDTCTNNFATWNPLIYPTFTNHNLLEGNLTVEGETSSPNFGIASTTDFTHADSEAYFETSGTNIYAGRVNSAQINRNGSDSGTDLSSTPDVGDIIGLALDLDSGTKTLKFYLNGSLVGTVNINTDEYCFICAVKEDENKATVEANFGGTNTYTVSSGNSDAEGFGNFEFAVPSGYFALCTKNLAEYG